MNFKYFYTVPGSDSQDVIASFVPQTETALSSMSIVSAVAVFLNVWTCIAAIFNLFDLFLRKQGSNNNVTKTGYKVTAK